MDGGPVGLTDSLGDSGGSGTHDGKSQVIGIGSHVRSGRIGRALPGLGVFEKGGLAAERHHHRGIVDTVGVCFDRHDELGIGLIDGTFQEELGVDQLQGHVGTPRLENGKDGHAVLGTAGKHRAHNGIGTDSVVLDENHGELVSDFIELAVGQLDGSLIGFGGTIVLAVAVAVAVGGTVVDDGNGVGGHLGLFDEQLVET
mmetsp:Transcript_4393/g.12638  ORF Transcript_4393/g.12638 Transcript_4393/m.12638 type:complete len:200 (+) Transcript_4393:2888-3487(+)